MWPDCGSCEGLKLFLLFSPNLTHSAGCSSCSFQGDGAAQRCRRGDREPQPSGQRQPRRERGERGEPGLQWPPAVQGGPSGGQRQPGSSAKQTERHTTEATWRWGVSTQTHAAWIQSLNIRVTFNYSWTEAADSDSKLCNSCTHYSDEVDAQRGGSSLTMLVCSAHMTPVALDPSSVVLSCFSLLNDWGSFSLCEPSV